MLESMATKYVEQKINTKKFNKKTFQYIETLAQWSELVSDPVFMSKRDSYALKYFSYCIQERKPKACHTQALSFWNYKKENLDTGFHLGKIFSPFSHLDSLPFFLSATTSKDFGEYYCKKQSVQKALYKHLYQKLFIKEIHHSLKSNITRIQSLSCWKSFSSNLILSLNDSETIKNFSFKLLKIYGEKIPQEKEDLYLTLYILNGPQVGKIFNLAWTTLKEISQDYKRRQRLIDSLKNLDPLPDKFLSLSDSLKKLTLIKLLNSTIPEYITYYTNSCLSYRSGKVLFKNGNPTIYCDLLFQITKKTQIIQQSIRTKYSSFKKF